jgi:hypothetical protein
MSQQQPGSAVEAGQTKPEDIVVFWVRRDTSCAECGTELERGSMIRIEQERALCLSCADLDHLVYLPRGDVALTRRASRHSRLRAVVVEWSRSRKRYERQGILVEPHALAMAEQECLSDAEVRERRRAEAAVHRERHDQRYLEAFAKAVRERYPSCPPGAEVEIAQHACEKYSGRVGRSAAAKELEPEAIDLAVRAHVRHRHTRYDDYLMAGWDRSEARAAVRSDAEVQLATWARPLSLTPGEHVGTAQDTGTS